MRRNHCYDQECKAVSEESQKAWTEWVKNKQNALLRQTLQRKRREAKRVLKRKKQQALDEELDEIERLIQEGNRDHYKKLRQIRKGYQARSSMI